jgi:hypothetical protein
MRLFSRSPKLGGLRDAAQTLLEAPATLSFGWALNVHAAYPALEDFARGISGSARDLTDDRLDGWTRALTDDAVALASIRAGAWAVEALRHPAAEQRATFRNEFGVVAGEESLADFVPDNETGDELRIARLSMEAILRSAGQFDGGEYTINLPALVLWQGGLSASRWSYTRFVQQFTKDGRPAEVLRYISD